jgi:RNA polymerase sigma-70 factor (ECF subfamily)
MEPHDPNRRLDEIETVWTEVHEAHDQQGSTAEKARNVLLMRYYGAVHDYLLGILHDATEAEELTQEFAVRFLRGDFGGADPQRGRFRDFLKTAVRHLVIDRWRQKKKAKAQGPRPLGKGAAASAAVAGLSDTDPIFVNAWREALLAKTWRVLARFEEATGQPYHTLLRAKAEQPALRSAQLAQQLGARLGKAFTEAGVRQTLHRARQHFIELLLAEVSGSLPTSDPKALEQELIELGLLGVCRQALRGRERPA